MAKEYFDRLTALMEQIVPGDLENVDLAIKHFFSGAAVYVDGKIAMTLTPVGFALKLPEKSREMLMRDHGAGELRYFPNAPIKKEYVVLPDSIVEDIDVLQKWVAKVIEYTTDS